MANEVGIMKESQHPNIVQYMDSYMIKVIFLVFLFFLPFPHPFSFLFFVFFLFLQGALFVVMEFMANGALTDMIEQV